jgi:hypothetical protein
MMLSNVKKLNLFSAPLLRRSSTIVSQWCGLIKLPYIPLDGLNHKLNGKNAVVLIDDVLYYAEQKNKKLLLIKESPANALDYRQLKSKCNDAWRAATTDEIQLIRRTLSPVPPIREDERHNESHSHNASYSSTTSSGEVDYAYALADEERRKKEFYRNYLIFDTLTDSRRKSDSHGGESKQSSGYSSSSGNHSSHSSDNDDSSDHSSSYDDGGSSYDGPSCGGSSSDD